MRGYGEFDFHPYSFDAHYCSFTCVLPLLKIPLFFISIKPLSLEMSPVNRIEPENMKIAEAYDDTLQHFRSIGWFTFLHKFLGHNKQVAESFAQTFNGVKARIGDLELSVDEGSIAKATGLPLSRKKWFKN